MVLYAVCLVRGLINATPPVRSALTSIRLTRINHCSLVPDEAKGTLQVAKDWITWGEVDEKTLAELIMKRGRMPGDKPVDMEAMKKAGFASVEAFAKAIVEGKAKLDAFGMKRIFRLHPPKSGYRHTKKPFPQGGLGPRKEKMNDLLRSMM
jgi:large subunit ribosomal protein L30